MKEKILPPIRESIEDYDAIEKRILKLFFREIYRPLLKEARLPQTILKNSMEDLVSAIKADRISYYRGQFTGKFSASVSRELKKIGAKWDRTQGSWKIPRQQLPPDVLSAIGTAESALGSMIQRIDDALSKVLPEEVADKFKAEDLFDRTLWKTEKNIMKAAKNISVLPQLSDSARARIAENYTDSLKLPIKNWTEEQIAKLRKHVTQYAVSGGRREGLEKILQESFGQAANKARFLARQETNLMMANFKEARYREMGSQSYIWTCVKGSPAHPVRPYHLRLDGKEIFWSNPPIVDEKGNRKHAGHDWNCRCTSRVIIKF